MKIYKKDILGLCNYSHPNFGQFASFLDGLSKDDFIEVPHKSDDGACAGCGQKCLYCLGLKDGKSKQEAFDEGWVKRISVDPCG